MMMVETALDIRCCKKKILCEKENNNDVENNAIKCKCHTGFPVERGGSAGKLWKKILLELRKENGTKKKKQWNLTSVLESRIDNFHSSVEKSIIHIYNNVCVFMP